MALRAVCLAVLLALAPPLAAQPLSQGEPVIRSPILSINYDRFFSGSQLGRALVAELEAERILLEAENRKIEAELEAEEVELTGLRDTMNPEAFREAASAFDQKVVRIRAERRQLALELTQKGDAMRDRFDDAARPVLAEIVRESGAVMVVDTRSVVLTLEAIDITELAISRLDAAQEATPQDDTGAAPDDEPAPADPAD
ncbi:chaperone for outer membrane proteins, Skp family [Lutimaribacter pacificus]|uniref:Periplasmic chaperone for outer membrane proteins Skp n=1 Tax=Lutimaribacter pacificus TaxID=391948 RepID=A0A1H0LQD2_9RHOB|nr:OmpH family outer membrane protein [Lutimaribacter pacificus]SDO70387.1 chaperone for outer membrane proteins, Skp family [Lutimaribacter pacificus]SHK04582.1 periplasmic chaperone for outer membrane proteins Skp [Lutimaribacter pacificus]